MFRVELFKERTEGEEVCRHGTGSVTKMLSCHTQMLLSGQWKSTNIFIKQ